MKRIGTTDGRFVDGTRRVPGTPVTASWLNGLQDEVVEVIESEGLQLEDKPQLLTALRALMLKNIIAEKDVVFDDVSTMRGAVIPAGKGRVFLTGYHKTAPGLGGGELRVDWQDKTTEDDGVRVFVTNNGVRLHRVGAYFSPYDAGAVGDGLVDDSSAFLRYAAAVDVVNIPRGIFKLRGNIFDVPVSFEIGGQIKVDAGSRVTFRDEIESPSQTIFTGAGEIVFSVGPNGGEQTRQCHASWWGIYPGSGLGDRAALIQKALDAYGDLREGVLNFDVGVYGVNSTITVPRGLEIRGQGTRKTVFYPYSDGWPVFKTKNTAVQFRDIQFETPRTTVAGYAAVIMRKSPYIEVWNSACTINNVMLTNSENAIKVWSEGCAIRNVGFNIDGQQPSSGSSCIAIHARYCTVDGVELKLGRTFATTNIIYIGATDYIDGISIRNIDSVASSRILMINAATGSIGNINIANINQFGTTGSPPAEAIKVVVGDGKYVAGLNISNVNINRYPLAGMIFDVANNGQLVDVNIGCVSILGSTSDGIGIEFKLGAGTLGMIRRVNIANTVSIVRNKLVVLPIGDARVSVINNQASNVA